MKALFVTAIGTEIGKTYVSAKLLEHWRAEGETVAAVKPVMSGFGEHELGQSDAGQLLAGCGLPVSPEAVSGVCLHRFEAPLAPNVAMRQAGVAQDYPAILDFTRNAMERSSAQRMIVEGAGGVMSPLTDDKLQIDFMADLDLPILLVAAPYLGAVSHILTALDALSGRGLSVDRLIVSQPDATSDPEALAHEVALFRDVPTSIVPHGGKIAINFD